MILKLHYLDDVYKHNDRPALCVKWVYDTFGVRSPVIRVSISKKATKGSKRVRWDGWVVWIGEKWFGLHTRALLHMQQYPEGYYYVRIDHEA